MLAAMVVLSLGLHMILGRYWEWRSMKSLLAYGPVDSCGTRHRTYGQGCQHGSASTTLRYAQAPIIFSSRPLTPLTSPTLNITPLSARYDTTTELRWTCTRSRYATAWLFVLMSTGHIPEEANTFSQRAVWPASLDI